MNNPLQTAKQALESANEIIIHLLENHPTARHHRKTGEALRQVNDAIQAIAHAENLKSEKSIENNQANSFRGSPDHIADSGKMVEEPVNTRSTSAYSEQVKQSIEEQGYVPLSDDAKFIFIDGFGEVPIDWDRYHGTTSAVQPVKQEPVAWMWACTECGTELEDDDTRKYCNSCGYNKFYKSPRILRQEPVSQEPVAHMYPSDLEKFETNETYAYAYSVAVGNPDERSVPLYTDPPRREWVEPSDEQITKLEYDCFAEICKQDNPTGEKLTALFIRRLLKLSKELNNG